MAVSNCLCVAGGIGYAISSYRELSGDMITTLILIRNTLSFAVNYGYVLPKTLWRGTFADEFLQDYTLADCLGVSQYFPHGCCDWFHMERFIVRHGENWTKAESCECRAVLERCGESKSERPGALMASEVPVHCRPPSPLNAAHIKSTAYRLSFVASVAEIEVKCPSEDYASTHNTTFRNFLILTTAPYRHNDQQRSRSISISHPPPKISPSNNLAAKTDKATMLSKGNPDAEMSEALKAALVRAPNNSSKLAKPTFGPREQDCPTMDKPYMTVRDGHEIATAKEPNFEGMEDLNRGKVKAEGPVSEGNVKPDDIEPAKLPEAKGQK